MQIKYDVVIVGGGVQGCAIAQASAAAGFSTLLLEQNTWGSATSCSSSKLIHGGLRYLQTGQFSLVRESLHEREWMFKKLPRLVKPNWFYIPIYKNSTIRPWQLFAGLTLYKCLSGLGIHSNFKRIPSSQWQILSGIKTEGLQAVFAYQDGQTDDKALTQHIQKSAEKLGATCLEQAKLTQAKQLDRGYRIHFIHNNNEQTTTCNLLINASGPWVNQTLSCITPTIPAVNIDLVQGSHLIIKEKVSDYCFYLESPIDQRAIFVLPWKDGTLIGTTETFHKDIPEKAQVLPTEIDYLLSSVKHYFPQQTLTILSSFCGLRVLPKASGSAFTRSREVILQEQDGMISVYGGKLTCWRLTAERVLSKIEQQLGKRKTIDTYDIFTE